MVFLLSDWGFAMFVLATQQTSLSLRQEQLAVAVPCCAEYASDL